MTTSEQDVEVKTGRVPVPALSVVTLVVVVLVVAAGFTHPWNSGGGLPAGSYTRGYSLTQQVEPDGLDRCLAVTVSGTMSATYRSPAWSLGGPGWTDPTLSRTAVSTRVTDGCGAGASSAGLDSLAVTQYWVTGTCADPVRGDWQESAAIGTCDRDLVAGAGTAEPVGPLSWKGTRYGDSVCLHGTVVLEPSLGDASRLAQLDGYRVCLSPGTATRA